MGGQWQIIHLHGKICIFKPLIHTYGISPGGHFAGWKFSSRSKSITLPSWTSRLFVHYTELSIFQRKFWAAEVSDSIAALWTQLMVTISMAPWCLLQLTAKQTKDWKLSFLSTTNSKNFAVEFALEWLLLLSWKNGVKGTKVYVSCMWEDNINPFP